MANDKKIDFEGPEYLDWIHQMTVAGYDRNITIPVDHADAMQGIYVLQTDNADIEKCLDAYEDFCRRWKALHEPGGDLHCG